MNKHKKKYIIIPLIAFIFSLAFLIFVNVSKGSSVYKTYNQFLSDIKAGKISTVYITSNPKLKVITIDGKKYETDNPRNDNLKETLLEDNIKVSENSPMDVQHTLAAMLCVFSLGALIIMFIKSSNIASKGMLGVDHIDASAAETKHNFDDVAGNEEAKESVRDIVDFLKNPERYSSYGARMPKGIILYGEPGTGKTLLAKAVAGEAGVPFYAMSGSDFIQVYVGVGASRIRQLFKKARSHGKAVIFIDEIDAIGKTRDNSKSGGSDERDQTLNALLTEMSGFNEKEGIIVIAATNRLDMLDAALLRPGRFDRHVEITLPDVSAREKIIALHLKNKPIGNIEIKEWAKKTSYFSGAKIESFINEAAIFACKDNSNTIEEYHMEKAYTVVLAGYEKVDRSYIKEKDRKITAFHEVGHALTSLLLLPCEKVSKVTIIPSTKGAGGYTLSIPEDSMYQNKDYLRKRIMVLLGGRASEEIVFGKEYITTGAFNDLKNSTSLVLKMVTQYGMGSTLGLLNLHELKISNNLSTDKIIDECKNVVNELYTEVCTLIRTNINLLEKISEELLQKETLHYEDLMDMINSGKNE